MGIKKASVFPDPVEERSSILLFFSIAEIAASCILLSASIFKFESNFSVVKVFVCICAKV
jgi:hypothetical protein